MSYEGIAREMSQTATARMRLEDYDADMYTSVVIEGDTTSICYNVDFR